MIETDTVYTGDCLDVLGGLPANSVHMAMTSPPYWQLRDYGDETEATFGGDPDCDHDWETRETPTQGGHNTDDNPPDVGGNSATQETRLRGSGGIESECCSRCGAWHGQLGLEPTVDLYVQHIADAMDAVKRVLRPDGSLWLNLGDTYSGFGGGMWNDPSDGVKESYIPGAGALGRDHSGLGRKNKALVPHRVAIECQRRGWVVRNDVTWVKKNPMPNPVKDRLNTTTEQVFHLTPNPDYWYDLDAIQDGPNGKNPGDVFEIATKPFPDAHFAVYPPELCEKPIKATAPPEVCAECGTGYVRESVNTGLLTNPTGREQKDRAIEIYEQSDLTREHLSALRSIGLTDAGQAQEVYDGFGNNRDEVRERAVEAKDVLGGYAREFIGNDTKAIDEWTQQCDCDTDNTDSGIVLDPFAGAGTTLLKAKELGRRFVGVELNAEYADMARARVGLSPEDPSRVRDDDSQTGLEGFGT